MATIVFPTCGRIVGKLVDEKGSPISGEAVGIWREEKIEEEFRGFMVLNENGITRGDGSFSFEALPKGTYTSITSVGSTKRLEDNKAKGFR